MHVPFFLGLVVGLAISPTTTQDSSDFNCSCTFEPSQVSGKVIKWVDAERLPRPYYIIPDIRYSPWRNHYGIYNVQVDWRRQRALLTPHFRHVEDYPEYLHDMESGTMYEKHPNGTCVFYRVPQEANIPYCLPNDVKETEQDSQSISYKRLDQNLYYRDSSRTLFKMKKGFECSPYGFMSIRLLPNTNELQLYQLMVIEGYNISNVEKTLYPNYQNCIETTWRLP